MRSLTRALGFRVNAISPTSKTLLNRGLATLGFIACTLALGQSSSVRGGQISFDSADGHWYEPVPAPDGITWGNAESAAVAAGGYLACPTDASENSFVFSLIDNSAYWTPLSVNSDFLGPWLGASASNDLNGSDATWVWVNGAPFRLPPGARISRMGFQAIPRPRQSPITISRASAQPGAIRPKTEPPASRCRWGM